MERYVIKFTKNNEAKFISHLDTLRTLHRAFRRAEIPIYYSKGFNPHASISIAAPLSIGIESVAEYADIELDSFIEPEIILNNLNSSLPNNIRIKEAIYIDSKMPASMAAVEWSKYTINAQINGAEATIKNSILSIMNKDEIMKLKKTKSGEKLINIRPLIKCINLIDIINTNYTFEVLLKSGSNGSLNPDIAFSLIKELSEECSFSYPFMKREEIYTEKNSQLVDLYTYFAGK